MYGFPLEGTDLTCNPGFCDKLTLKKVLLGPRGDFHNRDVSSKLFLKNRKIMTDCSLYTVISLI